VCVIWRGECVCRFAVLSRWWRAFFLEVLQVPGLGRALEAYRRSLLLGAPGAYRKGRSPLLGTPLLQRLFDRAVAEGKRQPARHYSAPGLPLAHPLSAPGLPWPTSGLPLARPPCTPGLPLSALLCVSLTEQWLKVSPFGLPLACPGPPQSAAPGLPRASLLACSLMPQRCGACAATTCVWRLWVL